MAQQDDSPIVADNYDDVDSAISIPVTSSLTSLRSSVMKYQVENGRTYHSMSSGKYAFPNDDGENERLDLQHNLWLLTLHGELTLCPKGRQGAKRVLDVGTGTGIWAIDYADLHPESEVIGVDLSPIQPSLVPPNCSFEVDDLEKEWTWTKKFDLILGRVIIGSFADYPAFFKKAFDALEPGGYIEIQDLHVPYCSDDGTLTEDMDLYKLGVYFRESSRNLGRPVDLAPQFKSMIEKAGFVDVVEHQFKWPFNTWPRDKYFKELGQWTFTNLDSGLDGLCLAVFTRGLGWTPEEVRVFCAKVRQQLRDPRIHSYCRGYIIYGKKPGTAPVPEASEEPASEAPAAETASAAAR